MWSSKQSFPDGEIQYRFTSILTPSLLKHCYITNTNELSFITVPPSSTPLLSSTQFLDQHSKVRFLQTLTDLSFSPSFFYSFPDNYSVSFPPPTYAKSKQKAQYLVGAIMQSLLYIRLGLRFTTSVTPSTADEDPTPATDKSDSDHLGQVLSKYPGFGSHPIAKELERQTIPPIQCSPHFSSAIVSPGDIS
jgi:hypothetical protein